MSFTCNSYRLSVTHSINVTPFASSIRSCRQFAHICDPHVEGLNVCAHTTFTSAIVRCKVEMSCWHPSVVRKFSMILANLQIPHLHRACQLFGRRSRGSIARRIRAALPCAQMSPDTRNMPFYDSPSLDVGVPSATSSLRHDVDRGYWGRPMKHSVH
jgi:hypothetical protein